LKQGFTFGREKKFIKEKITLRSDDQTLYHHGTEQESNFAQLLVPIDISTSGNAFSVVTTFPFASMVAAIGVYDMNSQNMIAVERTSALEGNERVSPFVSRVKDMTSYLEIPKIEAGRYKLIIEVPRAYFLPTKKFQTCLNFDLVIEYIIRDEKAESNPGIYDIL
jgi:hypothetical protein